jgi:hypothetical protein
LTRKAEKVDDADIVKGISREIDWQQLSVQIVVEWFLLMQWNVHIAEGGVVFTSEYRNKGTKASDVGGCIMAILFAVPLLSQRLPSHFVEVFDLPDG